MFFCKSVPATITLLCFASFYILSGCSFSNQYDSYSADCKEWHTDEISDLSKIPQNLEKLLCSEHDVALSSRSQEDIRKEFLRKWFAPWTDAEGAYQNSYIFAKYWDESEFYGQNLKPLSSGIKASIKAQADLDSFPNMAGLSDNRAITITDSVVRVIPYSQSLFSEPWKQGNSYPFDVTVMTQTGIGVPIRIIHRSADGSWVWCYGPTFYGWIKSEDIALVNKKTQNQIQKMKLYGFSADNVPLTDTAGRYLGKADISTLLPVQDNKLYVPVKNTVGYAILKQVQTKKIINLLFEHPVKLTLNNLAKLSDAMMGTEYSWGSAGAGRDCSGLVQDLYLNFGIILPRNSGEQRKSLNSTDISALNDDKKQQWLKENGKPLQTLIFMPGHVMIYAGTMNGENLVFHSLWGIRLKGPFKDNGILLIGKSAVTTLTPGIDYPTAVRDKTLLKRIAYAASIPNLDE